MSKQSTNASRRRRLCSPLDHHRRELERRGHTLREGGGQGVAQVIIYDAKDDMLDGGSDRRAADGAAVGVPGRTATRSTAAQR